MNLFILEDENFIKEGLSFFINRNFQEVLKVLSFSTGEEMLQKAQEITPHIVLSDINLPGMNGIEAIRQLKQHCKCQVLFISGYDDFDYLQSAIQLGANDYLLKPIDYKELKMKVTTAIEKLKQSKQIDYSIKYNQLLKAILGLEEKRMDFSVYPFDYFVVTLQNRDVAIKAESYDRFSFRIFGENIVIFNTDAYFPMNDQQLIVLHKGDLQQLNATVLHLLLKHNYHATALSMKKRQIIFDKAIFTDEEKLQQFVTMIEDTKQDSKLRLESIFAFLLQYSIHFHCLKTYHQVQQMMAIQHQFVNEETIQTIVQIYIHPLLQKITHIHDSRGDLSKKVIDYIYTHFDQPTMDLSYLSTVFHKSQANLSLMIKKSLNKNFIHLLNELRVDKAKYLLANTDKKNHQIAALVGYSNEDYFSKVFKKYVGMTPAKYREL